MSAEGSNLANLDKFYGGNNACERKRFMKCVLQLVRSNPQLLCEALADLPRFESSPDLTLLALVRDETTQE